MKFIMARVHISFLLILLFNTSLIFGQTENAGFELNIKSPGDIAATYAWSGTQNWGGSVTDEICAQLVWAEDGAETLACSPLANSDLDGKIALVRRGDCDFSLKAYHAQEAGAKAVVIVNHNESGNPEELVTMLGGDSATVVDIPVVFITYNSGMAIIPYLAEGNQVEICFEFPTFNLAFGPYSYFTPQSQIVALENMQVRVNNRNSQDQTDIETKLQITNPSGDMTELVTVHDAPMGEDVDVAFEPYLPSEVGKYSMKFISGYDGKEILREFEITDYTWGMDNGQITRSIGPSPEQFEEAEFFYQLGNLVLPATDAMVTHVSFGLGNGEELFTGDASADLILMAIYNADRNNDEIIDDFSSFEDLGDPLEIGLYELEGNETFDQLVTVPLDNPAVIEEGGAYYITLAYNGFDAGTGIAPSFSSTTKVDYLGPSTPLLLDQLYGGGWAGGTIVIRLHLEGFITNTKDIVPLAVNKLKILSNPVINDYLSFELNLTETNDRVDILFRNIEGKLIEHLKYDNIQNISKQINVSGLPAGTYFLNVNTDEGFRSEKVVVLTE